MPHWPLLLPPPAVSISPSRSRRFSSSIVVESPLRRPSPSSSRCAVHRRCAAPSITINLPSRRPSSPIAVVLLVHCRRARAIPRRQGAVARHPSPLRSHCAVHCHRGAVAPSLAIKEPSHRPLPSRSRCAVHCHRGAVAPYLAIKEPPAMSTDDSGHSSRPSQVVVALPLLTLPPPICRRLSLRHRLLCLSSVRLVVLSPCFSRRHLPSASAAVIQLLAVTGSYWAVLVRWYLTTGIYNYWQ
jgi:hypothetical protein